jgi:hypothetical protein
MALQSFSVLRAQDVANPAALVVEVTPKNWHRFPAGVPAGGPQPINASAGKPRYNSADYTGNAYGDDVAQAMANIAVARSDGGPNEVLPPIPRTQQDKANALGTTIVQDVGRRRGWIAPTQPYAAPPAASENPTIASLSPNTAVAGAVTPQFVMKIIGTKFTPYSTVLLGGIPAPSSIYAYVSPTEIRCQMSPGSSVAGTTTVTVVDHGVASTPSATFTWT